LTFKAEWKRELAEAVKEQMDPFIASDPWMKDRGAWGNWKPGGQTSSSGSSSLPSSAGNQGQEDTFQSSWNAWHAADDKGKAAIGAAVEQHQQMQHSLAKSAINNDFIPTQVFVRGWSSFGDPSCISKEKANDIIDRIKAELNVETTRLINSWTMFEPIQRIVGGPCCSKPCQDMIQQILSARSIKAEGKDLQAVVQNKSRH
jgi:hypothetical protein